MKQFSVVAFALVLVLSSVSSKTRDRKGVPPQSETQTKMPKGRLLVKKLPAGVQGVTITNGVVKPKPGYKFVKQDDGTIAVARIKRGGGSGPAVGGSWRCECSKTESEPETSCTSRACTLVVTVEGLTTSVIGF